MNESTILLIDCNPRKSTGETLEGILESSRLEGALRREVTASPSEVKFDWNCSTDDTDANPFLIFLILRREDLREGGALIQAIKLRQPEIPIIAVIENCGSDETLELLQKGASDFITLPLTQADTVPRAWRLLQLSRGREGMLKSLKEKVGVKQLIGKTANFLAEMRKIPLIARCDNRVLIGGETGTGKEMCARAIHYLSPRADKPFVPVNCGAIPTDLVENELFGHERGAFTGANTARAGLVEEAEGGTLFLDEIDGLPPMAQVKLLRFLQEKEYRRLGSSKVRHADVRVITATNKGLEEAVQDGSLRQDLYYRLNVVSIMLPPLRERREDIPFLVQHFLVKYANEFHMEVKTLSPEAIQKLTFYDWPGNVRELEHTIERAVMFCQSSRVSDEDIVLPGPSRRIEDSFQQAKAKIVSQFERDYIQSLLVSHDGNVSKAAQTARKNRRALWELIRKHRIDVDNFRPAHHE